MTGVIKDKNQILVTNIPHFTGSDNVRFKITTDDTKDYLVAADTYARLNIAPTTGSLKLSVAGTDKVIVTQTRIDGQLPSGGDLNLDINGNTHLNITETRTIFRKYGTSPGNSRFHVIVDNRDRLIVTDDDYSVGINGNTYQYVNQTKTEFTQHGTSAGNPRFRVVVNAVERLKITDDIFKLDDFYSDTNARFIMDRKGSLKLPSSTTVDRPGVAVPGDFRFNTDYDCPEYFNAKKGWVPLTGANTHTELFDHTNFLTVVTGTAGAGQIQIDSTMMSMGIEPGMKLLRVFHDLDNRYNIVQVFDNQGKMVIPDEVYLYSTTVALIDVSSFLFSGILPNNGPSLPDNSTNKWCVKISR
jgi:hypothetical protein